jgi:hypothetical protein
MMKTVLVAEIDHNELTLRLMEIGLGLVRPNGQSPGDIMGDAIAAAEGDPIKTKVIGDFQQMAAASIEFVAEQINTAKSIN